MKALVIGGTGFIGSHIVKNLLSKDIDVRVLIRKKSDIKRISDKRIEFKYGNIFEIDSLREHTKDVDLIYSVFGILGKWGVPEQKYWEINTKGVKNLLTAKQSLQSLKTSANTWKARNQLSGKIGKGKYALAEYEKIKRIVMPLDNKHLLYLTTSARADHSKIISKATKLKLK